jgi:uncharacterized membrane protein YczE
MERTMMAPFDAPSAGTRWWRLLLGLVLFGVSIAMMVEASLGVTSWDVLHQGLARQTGLSLGAVVVVVSVLLLVIWVPLRQRPGPGTVANAVVVGVVADVAIAVIGSPDAIELRSALLLGGIVVNAVATGLYVGAGLGPGPRDGLMTGLAGRFGWSIRATRTGIEVGVVVAGWLLGGQVGIGTVLFAIAIGPLVQLFLTRFTLPDGDRPATPQPERI